MKAFVVSVLDAVVTPDAARILGCPPVDGELPGRNQTVVVVFAVSGPEALLMLGDRSMLPEGCVVGPDRGRSPLVAALRAAGLGGFRAVYAIAAAGSPGRKGVVRVDEDESGVLVGHLNGSSELWFTAVPGRPVDGVRMLGTDDAVLVDLCGGIQKRIEEAEAALLELRQRRQELVVAALERRLGQAAADRMGLSVGRLYHLRTQFQRAKEGGAG